MMIANVIGTTLFGRCARLETHASGMFGNVDVEGRPGEETS